MGTDNEITEEELLELIEAVDKAYKPSIPLDEWGKPSDISEEIKKRIGPSA